MCAWWVQILFGKIKCWERCYAVPMMVLKCFYDFYSRRYHSTKICKNPIFWKILKWLINAKNQKITYLSVWQKFLPKLGPLIPQNFSINISAFEWNPICDFIFSRLKVMPKNRSNTLLMTVCSKIPNIPSSEEFFKDVIVWERPIAPSIFFSFL